MFTCQAGALSRIAGKDHVPARRFQGCCVKPPIGATFAPCGNGLVQANPLGSDRWEHVPRPTLPSTRASLTTARGHTKGRRRKVDVRKALGYMRVVVTVRRPGPTDALSE